jgi:hypothetical protein
MDNLDFVAHLANTASSLDASTVLVENFLRFYYQEMHAVATKWSACDPLNAQQYDEAFSELNAMHEKYWLQDTRFTEYWQPAIEPPETYVITDSGITIFSDMLGNFVAVVRTTERTAVYLLSVVRDELRIVNEFFR